MFEGKKEKSDMSLIIVDKVSRLDRTESIPVISFHSYEKIELGQARDSDNLVWREEEREEKNEGKMKKSEKGK